LWQAHADAQELYPGCLLGCVTFFYSLIDIFIVVSGMVLN